MSDVLTQPSDLPTAIAGIGGKWQGWYRTGKSGAPVAFYATIEKQPGIRHFVGVVAEDSIRGDVRIVGSEHSRHIECTQDIATGGSTKANKAVRCEGRIAPDGHSITGTWKLDGKRYGFFPATLHGEWEATRVNVQPLAALAPARKPAGGHNIREQSIKAEIKRNRLAIDKDNYTHPAVAIWFVVSCFVGGLLDSFHSDPWLHVPLLHSRMLSDVLLGWVTGSILPLIGRLRPIREFVEGRHYLFDRRKNRLTFDGRFVADLGAIDRVVISSSPTGTDYRTLRLVMKDRGRYYLETNSDKKVTEVAWKIAQFLSLTGIERERSEP